MEGKLLLIDKNFDESRKLKVNLENIGYTVFISKTLSEGLLIAKINNIDLLVFFDLDESLKTLRTVNSLYMPVMGVVGDDLKDKLNEYKDYLDDYIIKPFDKDQIYLKIKNLVKINMLQTEINIKSEEIERITRQINEINLIDKATGLYNAFYLNNIIQHECASSRRYGYKLSGLAFAIDGKGKNIDDGSSSLKELINIIKRSLRQNDTVARLDENIFYVLLPHTGLKDANFVAEKLRRRVEEYKFKSLENVTISLGVTSLNEIDSGIKKELELTENAKEALQRARDKGGNKVECF